MPTTSLSFLGPLKAPALNPKPPLTTMGIPQSTPSSQRPKPSHRSSYSSLASSLSSSCSADRSAACSPSSFEMESRSKPPIQRPVERATTPIRMGYPFYEEVTRQVDLKRERARRRRSLKVWKSMAGHSGNFRS
jgi:hypothetical protein